MLSTSTGTSFRSCGCDNSERWKLMRMEPLMETLQKSDGDEMHLEPGQRVYVVKQGQRSLVGREPVSAGALLQMATQSLKPVPVVGIGSEATYDRARVRKREVPSRVHETKRGDCRDHTEERVARATGGARRSRSRCRADSGCACRIGCTCRVDSGGAGTDSNSTSRGRSREHAGADAARGRSPERTGSERSRRHGSVAG